MVGAIMSLVGLVGWLVWLAGLAQPANAWSQAQGPSQRGKWEGAKIAKWLKPSVFAVFCFLNVSNAG